MPNTTAWDNPGVSGSLQRDLILIWFEIHFQMAECWQRKWVQSLSFLIPIGNQRVKNIQKEQQSQQKIMKPRNTQVQLQFPIKYMHSPPGKKKSEKLKPSGFWELKKGAGLKAWPHVTTDFGHSTWRSPAGAQQEISSLLAHNTRRCYRLLG